MSRQSHNDYLRSVPLFADLDDGHLDAISSATTELDLEAGTVLMRAGSSAREMVVVLDGELGVQLGETEIATIESGGFAGEMGLLADRARNATVVAKTDVRVLHLDSRSFDGVLDESPQIAVKMLPVVARRVTENNTRHSD